MNNQQAIETLMLFRPGTTDAQDPSFAEALDVARNNPEVGRWFEGHCAAYEAMRSKFKHITVPPGLKEQILSECIVSDSFFRRQRPVTLLAAVLAITVLVIGVNWWLKPQVLPQYRNRMVSTALRTYSMDFETNNLAQIRAFLATNTSQRDYVLPSALEATAVAGCKMLTWHGHRVSMICFNTGRPLPPGEKSDLWLFIIDRDSIPDAPRAGKAIFAKVNRLTTATWSEEGKTYILAGQGDEDFISSFL